jgi:hypothetical protein
MRLMILTGLAVILCSCGYKVPNSEACIELPSGKARCSKPLTGEGREIPSRQWRSERVGRISLSPEGYGAILKFIEDVCNRSQQCVSDLEKRINKFHRGFNGL